LEIAEEEMAQPTLTRDQVLFWLRRFRELNPEKIEHRRRLINSFVNAVYLYDDHLFFVGNYKDDAKTVTFAELEAAGIGSDLNAFSVPLLLSGQVGLPHLQVRNVFHRTRTIKCNADERCPRRLDGAAP